MNAANVIALNATQPFAYGKSASPAALNPVRVRFGPFELDEATARLSRDGTAVTLARRLFALLCALARRLGSLLTKHTLLDDTWGHQFVSDMVPKIRRETLARPCEAGDAACRAKRAVVTAVRKIDTSTRETGCTFLQPVFATKEEMRYADELRLQLRARLLRDAAPPRQAWWVGAD